MKLIRYNVDTWGYRYHSRVLLSGSLKEVRAAFSKAVDGYMKKYIDSQLGGRVQQRTFRGLEWKFSFVLPGGIFIAIVATTNRGARHFANGSKS